jgi:hypothetical protein
LLCYECDRGMYRGNDNSECQQCGQDQGMNTMTTPIGVTHAQSWSECTEVTQHTISLPSPSINTCALYLFFRS